MAQLYLKNGNIQNSKAIVETALTDNRADYALLMTAAEVYHLLGRPERSIALLQQAHELKPRNLAMLDRLAMYYEWNMQPLQAIPIYEDIVAAAPTRADTLRTLVSHYRYYGMPDKESHAIARLILLESATGAPSRLAVQSVLREELLNLANIRLKEEYEPLRDLLMQQLFVVSERLNEALRENETISEEEYTTLCLEHFLRTGKLQEGALFALKIDSIQGGVAARLRYSLVMQWNNLIREAFNYLKEVDRLTPGNEQVLLALGNVARRISERDTIEYALENLTRTAPDNPDYAEQLAEVYLESNKTDKALNLFDRLLSSTLDTFHILGRMLTAALFSGEQSTMRLALEKAVQYPTDRADIVETKVELHLALNEPDKAYALLRTQIEKAAPSRDQLERLLSVAQETGNPPTVLEAIRLALYHEPDDSVFLRTGADALLAVDDPAEAYRLLKKVAVTGRLEQDALRMLETAGFTADPVIVDDAATTAATLHPASLKVMDSATEIFLWVNSPAKALPYAEKAAKLSRGDKGQVLRMIEIASFTGEQAALLQALRTAGKLRPNDEDIAMASAQALASGGDTAAFEALLGRFTGSGRNVDQLRRWAVIAENAGITEQAYRLWHQIYKNTPNDLTLARKVAGLAFDTGHYKTSAEIWSRIAATDKKDFDAAVAAGTAWAAAGDTPQALAYFEKALAINPQDRPTMLEAARNALYSGKYKRSVELYETYGVSALQEEDRLILAEAYGNTGNAAKALELFAPLLAKDPLPKEHALAITRLLNIAGQRQKAASLYGKLARAYGDDTDFLANLGAEAFFADHLSPALEIFSKVLESVPHNATALKGSAMIHAENSNIRTAITLFREYNKRYPNDGDAHFRLAELYTVTGKNEYALKEYKIAARLLKRILRPDMTVRQDGRTRKEALQP